MTTNNPHEAADNAHVRIRALCAALEDDLHQMVQGIDNRAALADQLEGTVRQQRMEIERLRETITRLQSENANLSAHMETVATERDGSRARAMKTEQNRNEM